MLTINTFVVLFVLLTGILAEEPTNMHYHCTIGIPLAARIKEAEEAGRINEIDSRITGGRPAVLGNHPHFGGLDIELSNGKRSVCGSNLLSTTRSITAAHCWYDGEYQAIMFTVVLGSITLISGGTRVNTSDVQTHPLWIPYHLINDIAMIRFPSITLTNVIQPINLPVDQTNNMFDGVWASAAGFGRMGDAIDQRAPSPYLNEVELQVMSKEKCGSIDSILCVDGSERKSACKGDSGGPLALMSNNQRILIGVAAFIYDTKFYQVGSKQGFTRVTSHIPWIQANL